MGGRPDPATSIDLYATQRSSAAGSVRTSARRRSSRTPPRHVEANAATVERISKVAEARSDLGDDSDTLTQQYSQDNVDERVLLIQADAEAAVNEDARRARSGVPSTAPVEYGHMPVPIRGELSGISTWTIGLHASGLRGFLPLRQ